MFSVWIPIIQHKYITDTYEISNATIASLRLQPDDALLKEIGGYGHFVSGQLSVAEDQTTDQTITIANSLLQGIIELYDFPKIKFSISFNPKDLQQGSSSWQLRVASFIIPRSLLVAYASTGDEKYFTAARDYIFKWRDYEQSAWLPSGFLWNDHAMAGRVAVLTNFWRFYRNHPRYAEDEARKFLKLVILTGA
jgi:hypothetical protein